MASEEDIQDQLERLAIHRGNLAHFLRQHAHHGAARVPLDIANGIVDERHAIQHIKHILLAWHVTVEQHPDDSDQSARAFSSAALSKQTLTQDIPTLPSSSDKQTDIPEAVSASIRTETAMAFPSDFATQRYRIRTETQAWCSIRDFVAHNVPLDVFQLIKRRAEEDFPTDFGTQLYRIKSQLDAWHQLQAMQENDMPSAILEAILRQARAAFPDDFTTQMYQIKQQISAWQDIQ